MVDNYMTVQDTAKKWGLKERTVQIMCSDGKIPGVVKFGRAWAIPAEATKPTDNRIVSGEYRNWRKKETDDSEE